MESTRSVAVAVAVGTGLAMCGAAAPGRATLASASDKGAVAYHVPAAKARDSSAVESASLENKAEATLPSPCSPSIHNGSSAREVLHPNPSIQPDFEQEKWNPSCGRYSVPPRSLQHQLSQMHPLCLYLRDRYTSVVEGRPTAISDDEWDTPFPSSDTPDIANLGHHVGLCELLGRISNFINWPGCTDAQCEVSTITANLAAWHVVLPLTLAARPPEGSAWSLHHHLHVISHAASVLLW
ncbi:hypothetical protein BC830DRAFT_1172090 [Chytriomyces sp. MP71]|nr:hypothetical protein BC830DRAFT_1172090 [Chytriomyces sp. MP71]